MRTVLKLVVILVPVLALAVGTWWWQRDTSANPVERWCADQLRRIAADLFVPAFDFGTIQLEIPAAVTLDDVSFTADGVVILAADSMRLEFRETPRPGQPLVIEAVMLDAPEVRLVGSADGTMVGFSDLIRSSKGKRYEDGGSSKPSDFLVIRRIVIRDGMFEWNPHGHEIPMHFAQIGMDLTTSPNEARPGSYAFDVSIARPPVIELACVGAFDLDTADLALDKATLQVDLDQNEYAALTPSTQEFLRAYSIVGNLTLQVNGLVPLNRAEDTELTIEASLKNSSAVIGDYQLPVDSAALSATFGDRELAFDPLTMNAFNGEINATGALGFADDKAFQVDVTTGGVLIQNLLRPEPGEEPKFAGRIDLSLDVSGSMASPSTTLEGTGTLTFAEARLISLPVFTEMAEAMRIGKPSGTDDRGTVDFRLTGDRALIDESIIESTWLAARGTGTIHYDGRLDLRTNAGVFERAQSLLGGLGDIFAVVTDNLLPYLITGTWSEPVVTPKPFGLGAAPSGG